MAKTKAIQQTGKGGNRNKTKARPQRVRRRWLDVTLILIFLVGLAVLAYPAFSEYWNAVHSSRAIIGYAEKVANLDKEKYEAILNQALDYNWRLVDMPNQWNMTEEELQDYETQLNIDGTGNMGFIQIPKINVQLPMYHGTDEAVLQTSIGHIVGTSLPVGSPHDIEDNFDDIPFPSHCVMSGHRGLPSARLFSDLDQMEIGDIFILTILDQTLTYEVDEINIVDPNDTSKIQIVPGMDLCTLVTCTPYGINTHRLLVRGRRIENEATRLNVRITADAIRIDAIYVAPFIAAPVLLLLAMWVMMLPGSGGRKRY